MTGLSAQIKQELCTVTVTRRSSRIAEIAAVIRLAGTIEHLPHHIVVEIELDALCVARRVKEEIEDLFGNHVSLMELGAHSSRKAPKYLLRISEDADKLIRRVGLVTRSGHTVVGLPPQVIAGAVTDQEAAWRGAFLAAGTLGDPGRSSGLEIAAPGQEASLALAGCARRFGITAKTKESRGQEKVTIRDGEAISALLSRLGAHSSRIQWDQKRQRLDARPTGNRLANFDDANLRRSARAAVAAAARVERAMAILGDDVPDHLAEAGLLRVRHRQASLEELGRLADPQMTKDAVAGRIRRLLSMADKRAEELGLPNTLTAVTEELLDEL
ncbi:DNA-binding protein WhiA [Corynebacterium sp. ES2794-CONJ1]|uniref:DNA-binding protein WhiA n=1 Tax=unclassified Corynebacterium TaxID=2624378 RepID=UPI0021672EE5|nr:MULTISPECIES: DNA-binding protein WhiA [unclassified Corynebacterium]MCS4489283.1 DNA-binding protein WhiA [Corynebacterium sp. ES2775-CONJ]MCS4491096.1 DNA-binding protein WhiA [Corynebacterium sp. ES2715-CONJ3]MCS4531023.1 DNA-binding protein WhiA [Corynebacterium sp. ES2730-CONJ]MCU9518390.1 DNA-binding protein WhiA [Corynebacterium sp. ES2794-CONJ1]